PTLPAPSDTIPNPSSYNHVVRMTVYDSLGKDHQLTQYFRKDSVNNWSVYYQLGNEPIDPAQAAIITFNSDGTIIPPDPANTPPDPTTPISLTFNAGAIPSL